MHGGLLAAMRDAESGQRCEVLARLCDRTLRERDMAQGRLRAEAERTGVEQLESKRRKLIDRLDRAAAKRSAARFDEHARRVLPQVVEQVREAGEADLADIERLHELRLTGKRLRYTMEVFAPCFGKPFRKLYDAVESMQERLGDVNDLAELADRIGRQSSELGLTDDEAGLWESALALENEKRGEAMAMADRFRAEWSSGRWAGLLDDLLEAAGIGDPGADAERRTA